jgi:hypothetical protein
MPDMTCQDNFPVTLDWNPVAASNRETIGYYVQVDDDPNFFSNPSPVSVTRSITIAVAVQALPFPINVCSRV